MAQLLIQNELEIMEALHQIDHFKNDYTQKYCQMDHSELIAAIKDAIIHSKPLALKEHILLTEFLMLGGMTLRLIELENPPIPFDPSKFAIFLMGKHQKYGAAPIIESGKIGIILRMLSKINRFKNLYELDTSLKVDEEDTLKDILGYCVLGYWLERRPIENS